MGIYHESNTFVEDPTTIADFKNGRWLKGQAILDEYASAHHELGGAIEIFRSAGAEIVPVFYAETTPGGIIQEEAYDLLVTEMIQELRLCLPVSACFIVPHGAAVAINHPDMDGDWISMLRNTVGNDIPIVGTLDPHANISEAMISKTQGLFPYSTNPHIDQRETGKKAASYLLDLLHQHIDPFQLLVQLSLAISIDQQNTSLDPCKSLYEYARELESGENTMHVNIALGFPYADVHEMGSSIIIITDKDRSSAEKAAQQIKDFALKPGRFKPAGQSFEKLWQENKNKAKPILLLDMGDNIGGGGRGNSTYILDKLDEQDVNNSLSCIYDPKAVIQCSQYKPGQEFRLVFGQNPGTDNAYDATVKLARLQSGTFEEKKPRHGGQLRYDMGSTAVVQTKNGHTIILHSKRVPPFSLEQVKCCDIDPGQYDIIIAKGVIAPIAAYGTVCPTIVQVNSPGVTQADMTRFHYKNRRKPLYPFEAL